MKWRVIFPDGGEVEIVEKRICYIRRGGSKERQSISPRVARELIHMWWHEGCRVECVEEGDDDDDDE